MTRVACVMMQKNEDALLEPWLQYHGFMFGFDNLYVFDNGSTSISVLDVLATYAKKGVNVVATYGTVDDYANKGEIVAECIRRLQREQSYDVALPLDCDEFVVLKIESGATVDRAMVLEYLESIIPGGGLLRVNTQLFNIINRPGEFGIQGYTKTVIILDGTFMGSDHGHHHCTTTIGSHYRECEIAYVHFHYKPLQMLKEHARSKLAPFVDVDDPVKVSSFEGPGHHLRPYLTMTDTEFAEWHKGDTFYKFVEFSDLLASLNARIPF